MYIPHNKSTHVYSQYVPVKTLGICWVFHHEFVRNDVSRGELWSLSDITESSTTIVQLGTYTTATRF